jgi:thiol-disulfide isomerase/thioredoxin
MKKVIPIALLLLVQVSALAQSSKQTALLLQDMNGRQIRLTDYKGRVVLINFWAIWCIPCRTEIPDLIKKQRQYRDRGLRIIGVTYPPQKISEVRVFARKLRINYPVAIGTKSTKDLFTQSETLPMTVVIDRDGAVRDVIEGIMYSDEFDEKVRPLLQSKRSQPVKKARVWKPRSVGVQRATIAVSATGYRPASVKLQLGLPAELTFIRKVDQTCGRDIVIPDYGINRPLPLNTPVLVAFTPTKSGRFKFTCGVDMFRGSVIVQ